MDQLQAAELSAREGKQRAEILKKIPKPIFEIASELESSLGRASAVIRTLVCLLRKAAHDNTEMDSQDLLGVSLMLETVDGDLTIGKRKMEILFKRIAETSEMRQV